eukprot:6318722-Amphidinium_carterae.2
MPMMKKSGFPSKSPLRRVMLQMATRSLMNEAWLFWPACPKGEGTPLRKAIAPSQNGHRKESSAMWSRHAYPLPCVHQGGQREDVRDENLEEEEAEEGEERSPGERDSRGDDSTTTGTPPPGSFAASAVHQQRHLRKTHAVSI